MKSITKLVGLILTLAATMFTAYTLFQFLSATNTATLIDGIRAASLPVYGGIAILIGLALYIVGMIEER